MTQKGSLALGWIGVGEGPVPRKLHDKEGNGFTGGGRECMICGETRRGKGEKGSA